VAIVNRFGLTVDNGCDVCTTLQVGVVWSRNRTKMKCINNRVIRIDDVQMKHHRHSNVAQHSSWAWRLTASTPSDVLGMTLNCIHIRIVTGSFFYRCVMRPASQRFFIHSCIYLRILIISYLETFLGTNSLSVLMCRKAVNQSINHSRSSDVIHVSVGSNRHHMETLITHHIVIQGCFVFFWPGIQ